MSKLKYFFALGFVVLFTTPTLACSLTQDDEHPHPLTLRIALKESMNYDMYGSLFHIKGWEATVYHGNQTNVADAKEFAQGTMKEFFEKRFVPQHRAAFWREWVHPNQINSFSCYHDWLESWSSEDYANIVAETYKAYFFPETISLAKARKGWVSPKKFLEDNDYLKEKVGPEKALYLTPDVS